MPRSMRSSFCRCGGVGVDMTSEILKLKLKLPSIRLDSTRPDPTGSVVVGAADLDLVIDLTYRKHVLTSCLSRSTGFVIVSLGSSQNQNVN